MIFVVGTISSIMACRLNRALVSANSIVYRKHIGYVKIPVRLLLNSA